MRNLKNIMIMLLIGLFAVGFFSSCAEADTSLSDGEKAVLVQKAVTEGLAGASSGSGSSGSQARTITGGTASVLTGQASDFTGSDFYISDVSTWTSAIYIQLTFDNLTVTVQDESGNMVTVTLDGSMNLGMDLGGSPSTTIMFGSISVTVDGENLGSYTMDLKISSSDNKTFTITGTAGSVTINETYTVTAM